MPVGEHPRCPRMRSRDDRLESGLRGLHALAKNTLTGSAPHGVGAGPAAPTRKPTTLTTTMIAPRRRPDACVPARRQAPRRRRGTSIDEHRINAKLGQGSRHSMGLLAWSKLLAPGDTGPATRGTNVWPVLAEVIYRPRGYVDIYLDTVHGYGKSDGFGGLHYDEGYSGPPTCTPGWSGRWRVTSPPRGRLLVAARYTGGGSIPSRSCRSWVTPSWAGRIRFCGIR